MSEKDSTIEQRMQNIKKFYAKVDDVINKLPDSIPGKTKDTIRGAVLGDKDLKKLMEGIDSHRPPRIFLIGRTGVGKSSLINALCGSYVAKVSDTTIGTTDAQSYKCKDGDRTLMEIFDTRGIAESDSIDPNISAEDALIEEINEFSPDVAIFMLNSTHRDAVDSDAQFLKKLAKSYSEINSLRLPIVVVVNKCDEVAPDRLKDPKEYSEKKVEKIKKIVQYYKGIIVKNGLKIDDIIAVSSLIDWKTPDGEEVDVEDIDNLPQSDIDNLQMAFDGRYHIKELLDILEKAIQDFDAQMGLRMAARLTEVVRRLANHLTKIFSGIAATVALTPIPISDIYILLILQAILVALIASLSGRDVTLDAAKEFVLGLGGVAGTGFALRTIAQQASKMLNAVMPTAGSFVSSGIAALGTGAIGKAAISYYIDENDIDEAKKVFTNSKKECNEKA